jgi:hypothetical protein
MTLSMLDTIEEEGMYNTTNCSYDAKNNDVWLWGEKVQRRCFIMKPDFVGRRSRRDGTMTTPIFTTIEDGDTYHTMILGTSGQGKSVLLQAEARRLGITYEELLQRMEPTEGQKEQQRIHQEAVDQAEEQRLNAVREAFWQNTPAGHHDLRQIHDVLGASDIVAEPTADQIKALFMMLPADIIGSALSWGFSDTEVRERVYEFVEQNKQTVLEAVSKGKAE